jgi:hypothetical protein
LPWSLNVDDLNNSGRIWVDTHIRGTLSLLLYKVAGVSRVYDKDFSNNLDEEDILRVYTKDLPIYLVYERGASTKKHD